MTLRAARQKDISELFNLYVYFVKTLEKIRPERYSLRRLNKKKWIRQMKSNLRNPKYKVIVHEEGNSITGFGYGDIRKNLEFIAQEEFGYIELIVVKPEFQGKGIATHIAHELINFFTLKKMKIIYMTVDLKNEQSLRIWPKLGFRENFVDLVLDI